MGSFACATLCGGLTAHYRLGARAPAATLFVGALLIAIALLFRRAAVPVRTFIPLVIFRALLFYVGWQHLLLGSNVPQRRHFMLVAVAFPPSPGIIFARHKLGYPRQLTPVSLKSPICPAPVDLLSQI